MNESPTEIETLFENLIGVRARDRKLRMDAIRQEIRRELIVRRVNVESGVVAQ